MPGEKGCLESDDARNISLVVSSHKPTRTTVPASNRTNEARKTNKRRFKRLREKVFLCRRRLILLADIMSESRLAQLVERVTSNVITRDHIAT